VKENNSKKHLSFVEFIGK